MAMNTSIKTVDDYLKDLPKEVRMTLERLRSTITSVAPKAEEGISYGMPAYKYFGALVYFAAFKNHCSFFPGNSKTIKLFDELKEYRTSKGTIQFTVDKPLPSTLVKKIVQARMVENEASYLASKTRKSERKSTKTGNTKAGKGVQKKNSGM